MIVPSFGRLVLALGLVAGLSSARAADPDRLAPLPYNNPGLVVDLGVGLWAYPMPVDYDGDGDLDLLVSCPDKPSNGTYYFENPSQDPQAKTPVFKPGVRVGDGHHYMSVNAVGGRPVLLTPGREYRVDEKTGRLDLTKSTKIDLPTVPNAAAHPRTRANMWRYVDYDGDGDRDLIIGLGDWTEYGWDHAYDSHGRWRNGPLHGYVYLVTNEGTDGRPEYPGRPRRLTAGGGTIDVYGWPSPCFADFDGDGDLDLICGEFLDGFTYFRNLGSRTEPSYASGVRPTGADGRPLTMHLQMITPTAVDWDADGDVDLIVGDEDGRVALVEHTGQVRDGVPVFAPPRYFQQEADTLKFGALATPVVVDWDDDGDDDLVCGNTAGQIGWFENLGPAGEDGLPKWSAPRLLEVATPDGGREPFRILAGPSGSIQGPCEAKWGYTTFSVADWDGDGDLDIVFNSILGRLGLLENAGGVLTERVFDTGLAEPPPAWAWQQTTSSATLTQWRTTPRVVDWDGDGRLDLVMLDQEGYLTLRRHGGAAERIFVDEEDRPLRLNAGSCGASGRVKLDVVDWDGDDRLDVVVNSENALWYRNVEDRPSGVVLKRVGNLGTKNISGHDTSPYHCDFDRDGTVDLVIGSENGRIYHLRHEDAVTFPAEALRAAPAKAETSDGPVVRRESITPDDGKPASCGHSTICETTRGLVAAWIADEGTDHASVRSSYHDGKGWTKPAKVADGLQHDDLRYPCTEPVLVQPPGDAPTLLFFRVETDSRSTWTEMMVSYDRGRTFRDRRRLPDGITGPLNSPPEMRDDGRTLVWAVSGIFPSRGRLAIESTELVDGVPDGRWHLTEPRSVNSMFGSARPVLLGGRDDSSLVLLGRIREGALVTCRSDDEGRTWSFPPRIARPESVGSIAAVTLADGRSLLVASSDGGTTGASRDRLLLAVSADGETWPSGPLPAVPAAEGVADPAAIEGTDGLVRVSYTTDDGRIDVITIDPARLETGAAGR